MAETSSVRARESCPPACQPVIKPPGHLPPHLLLCLQPRNPEVRPPPKNSPLSSFLLATTGVSKRKSKALRKRSRWRSKAGAQGVSRQGRASKLLRILSSGKKAKAKAKVPAKRRKPGKKALQAAREMSQLLDVYAPPPSSKLNCFRAYTYLRQ